MPLNVLRVAVAVFSHSHYALHRCIQMKSSFNFYRVHIKLVRNHFGLGLWMVVMKILWSPGGTYVYHVKALRCTISDFNSFEF